MTCTMPQIMINVDGVVHYYSGDNARK